MPPEDLPSLFQPHQEVETISVEGLPETVITPPSGWLQFRLAEIWTHWDLLTTLAWRHIQVRYKQAVLGGLWAVLQPAAAAAAFTLIFRNMVGSTGAVPYLVFAYSGVLLWQMVASIVGTGSMSLVDNAPLITKVYFPRLLIPLSVVAYSLVDFAIGSIILAGLMLWFGCGLSLAALSLPVAIAGAALCGLGISVFLAALTIKYRDFRFVVPFILQLWFFLSPVIYPITRLPMFAQNLIGLNPMTGWIELFRFGLFGGIFPIRAVIVSAVLSTAMTIFGIAYFRQVETHFADII
jgi:lipopolysaccharide transport system permease protein